jgi:hypothetical protein
MTGPDPGPRKAVRLPGGTAHWSGRWPTGSIKEANMAQPRKKARITSQRRKRPASGRWSARVTRESHAMDLEKDVFTLRSPRQIAASLKRSAEHARNRKSPPFRSAMSMLSFYINRAGGNLPASRKRILEKAKEELRAQFGRAKAG